MCHMIADTEAELHAMAYRLGIARRWFQGDHYDICLSKRGLAVGFGAREITRRQASAMTMLKKHTGEMGPPETAWQRLLAVYEARRAGGEVVG